MALSQYADDSKIIKDGYEYSFRETLVTCKIIFNTFWGKNIIIKSLILQSAELNFVEEVETINKFLIWWSTKN